MECNQFKVARAEKTPKCSQPKPVHARIAANSKQPTPEIWNVFTSSENTTVWFYFKWIGNKITKVICNSKNVIEITSNSNQENIVFERSITASPKQLNNELNSANFTGKKSNVFNQVFNFPPSGTSYHRLWYILTSGISYHRIWYISHIKRYQIW